MAADYDETLHVMKFAEVTQEVKTARGTGVKNNLGESQSVYWIKWLFYALKFLKI